MSRLKRAQSTAEYAILIGLVIAAVLAMQTYVKRGLNSGIKFGVDKAVDKTRQYEPYYLRSEYTTATSEASDNEEGRVGGAITRSSSSSATRSGTQSTLGTAGADGDISGGDSE